MALWLSANSLALAWIGFWVWSQTLTWKAGNWHKTIITRKGISAFSYCCSYHCRGNAVQPYFQVHRIQAFKLLFSLRSLSFFGNCKYVDVIKPQISWETCYIWKWGVCTLEVNAFSKTLQFPMRVKWSGATCQKEESLPSGKSDIVPFPEIRACLIHKLLLKKLCEMSGTLQIKSY